MKIDIVKDRIIKIYQKSLYVSDCHPEIHPIRIIESCKSLIGIDINNPEIKLVEFCENYSKNFSLKDIIFNTEKLNTPVVVTYLDLELSLLNNKKKKTFKNLYYLSQVSDGRHILEFLLEFSIKYCSNSFLLIWSVYRMELFLGFSNVLPSLLICANYIFLEEKITKSENFDNINIILKNYIFEKESLNIFLNLYRIYNDDIIRKIKINPYVITKIKNDCNIFKNNEENQLLEEQKNKGRIWILDYLKNIKFERINKDLILNLDACRGCLKMINSKKEEKYIWNYINKLI